MTFGYLLPQTYNGLVRHHLEVLPWASHEAEQR